MFGGSKAEVRRERTSGLSVIGADMTIRGDITTEGDLHVDGLVEGAAAGQTRILRPGS